MGAGLSKQLRLGGMDNQCAKPGCTGRVSESTQILTMAPVILLECFEFNSSFVFTEVPEELEWESHKLVLRSLILHNAMCNHFTSIVKTKTKYIYHCGIGVPASKVYEIQSLKLDYSKAKAVQKPLYAICMLVYEAIKI